MSLKVGMTDVELNDLYWNRGFSMSEIAPMFRCDPETVRNRMIEYGIPRREMRDALRGKNKGRRCTAETRKKMSIAAIERIIPPESRKVLSGGLSLYDISKEEFEEMYCIQRMTQSAIAQLFGCSREAVMRHLKRHGIPLLSKSDACSIANKGRPLSIEHRQKLSECNKGEKNFFFGKHFAGEDHPRFGKSHSKETLEKMSRAHKGAFAGEKNFFFGKHFIGDINPNWRGGTSFEPYCHKFNEAFKEAIREKFGRVCFLCPTTEEENGRKLTVHHVQYNKDCLCEDSNCEFVPLCNACHGKTNFSRDYWTDLIMSKLNEIKEV